jgi:N-acetyl-gamma-glutamyl-phosphate/LysW-gamma-L-alpha-aminoadipyl-6-phosphate reductase
MASKRFRAAVIGGSGYGAAELIRRLLAHPAVELTRVASIDFVGEPLWAVHPNLEGHTDLRFEALAPAEAARGIDVVFLGLPHFVSAQNVPAIMSEGARIVDMSGDFRLRDLATYEAYYGGKHPCPDVFTSGRFVYGLPELNRDAIRATRYVASPGCFATAIELALLPLAKAGLLNGTIEVVGVTGSSGSGALPSATTHHAVRASNLRTYKPLGHQHVPEIVQTLTEAGGQDVALEFVPVSAPLVRGIFATCFAHVDASVGASGSERALESLWRETYAGERFVRVPKKRLPEVAVVKGTNYAEVGIALGEAKSGRRTVACFAALDNVIKGGAGQAIQSMNLMLDLDEGLTLEDPGGYP